MNLWLASKSRGKTLLLATTNNPIVINLLIIRDGLTRLILSKKHSRENLAFKVFDLLVQACKSERKHNEAACGNGVVWTSGKVTTNA